MSNLNRKYPHLLPDDVAVWERFISQHPNKYESLSYDVRVGFGRPASTEHPEAIQRMALNLSMRRIDAIGIQPDHLEIIEITHSLGFKAIGQILSYPILYQLTYQPQKPLRALIVCAAVQSDITPALHGLNIRYEIA